MATAKLFVDDGEQAVRLPDEFRFAGTEVRIRRVGDGVMLEPVSREAVARRADARTPGDKGDRVGGDLRSPNARKWTEEEIDALWAKIDSYGVKFPKRPEQPPIQERDFKFD